MLVLVAPGSAGAAGALRVCSQPRADLALTYDTGLSCCWACLEPQPCAGAPTLASSQSAAGAPAAAAAGSSMVPELQPACPPLPPRFSASFSSSSAPVMLLSTGHWSSCGEPGQLLKLLLGLWGSLLPLLLLSWIVLRYLVLYPATPACAAAWPCCLPDGSWCCGSSCAGALYVVWCCWLAPAALLLHALLAGCLPAADMMCPGCTAAPSAPCCP